MLTLGEMQEQQVNKAIRTGSAMVVAEKKVGSGGNPASVAATAMSARRLDEEGEDFHLAKPSMEMRKLLQQERMKAKLTQVELAQMCNVKPSIIADYENGKGIPNPIMLGKIERAIRAKNPEMPFGALTKAQKKG